MENLLFLGVPILKHIRVSPISASHRADKITVSKTVPVEAVDSESVSNSVVVRSSPVSGSVSAVPLLSVELLVIYTDHLLK